MEVVCTEFIDLSNLGETFASSSSLSHRGEIKGLVSISALPSFL